MIDDPSTIDAALVRHGACLCAAVTYRVDGTLRDIVHCHCENCRRVTGNFCAATSCRTAELVISDHDDHLRWYDLGYARYGFCGVCGSTLFWVGAEHEERTSIEAGTLDDASALKLEAIWFADEAHGYNSLDASVPHFGRNGSDDAS